MSGLLDRPVWPIFAWISGGLFASMLAPIWAVSFVDNRWEGFLVVNVLALLASVVTTFAFAVEGTTYTKRPRGWRKLRREAERQAYIERLERELL